jgi:aldehyde:ferredoxin oxidoreductase
MECYEKGLVGRADLDGLDLTWGNVPSVEALLHKIARREGCGDWLAEGVMRASARLGGEAPALGVYTLKGASPRSHDHRARWHEFLDTCLSNTSTIEASFGQPPDLPGAPRLTDPFSPEQVATANAVTGGWRQFEDCLGICRFCSTNPLVVLECVNSVTGWQIDVQESLAIGQRAVNQLRVFNFRHGLDPTLEAPSPRYGSTPVDGPAEGKAIAKHFEWMKRSYWQQMGWDVETGRPLPETLERLGLADLVAELNALE